MNGDTVDERGARGKPRELWNQDEPPGLVPRLEGGDKGVEERAICHGAGEVRRITV